MQLKSNRSVSSFPRKRESRLGMFPPALLDTRVRGYDGFSRKREASTIPERDIKALTKTYGPGNRSTIKHDG